MPAGIKNLQREEFFREGSGLNAHVISFLESVVRLSLPKSEFFNCYPDFDKLSPTFYFVKDFAPSLYKHRHLHRLCWLLIVIMADIK